MYYVSIRGITSGKAGEYRDMGQIPRALLSDVYTGYPAAGTPLRPLLHWPACSTTAQATTLRARPGHSKQAQCKFAING